PLQQENPVSEYRGEDFSDIEDLDHYDMKEEEPVDGKKSEDEGIEKENLAILEKIRKNQRQDHLNGAVSGSVQASDRLMKELRDIYRSQSYKTEKGSQDIHPLKCSSFLLCKASYEN
uniref:Uncharacterized protein n=1 Tax=Strix occidentalis caurina TaxID=311401 RepID=A0A8D0EKS9_STROC